MGTPRPMLTQEKAPVKKMAGEKYNLIPLTEDDVTPRYVEWLNDPESNRFLEARFTRQTEETVREYVRSFYRAAPKYIWGIYPAAVPAAFIGTVTLSQIHPQHGSAEIGLLVGEKSYWGKDASGEAMKLAIRFAFESLGLRRLTGGSYAPNHGMNFTFKCQGFRCEAKLVKAYCLAPGEYVDGYRWALLAEEWKGKKLP